MFIKNKPSYDKQIKKIIELCNIELNKKDQSLKTLQIALEKYETKSKEAIHSVNCFVCY